MALIVRAQQPALPVIGFLNIASADGYRPMVAAFREGRKHPAMSMVRAWLSNTDGPTAAVNAAARRLFRLSG